MSVSIFLILIIPNDIINLYYYVRRTHIMKDTQKQNSLKIYDTSTEVLQKLLYDKPLYNYINDNNVNVAVFGFSQLSQKFIDVAFEASQVNSFKLNITVVSDKEPAKNEYLEDRPAFADFFDVDNNVVNESYGSISFVTKDFARLEDVVSETLVEGETGFSYIFIDTDNDKQNFTIAKFCDLYAKMLSQNSIINFVSSKQRKIKSSMNLVLRDDSIKNHKDFTKLKRMSLNAHLVWNNRSDIDIRKLQREFNTNYYFSSSFNNILSIKYKLNSVGIDFNSSTAAEEFYKLVNSKVPNDVDAVASLIQSEHKRWNVNMICDGYSPQTDLDKCLNSIKDKKNKLHPCIVHSGKALTLSRFEWKEKNNALWDNAGSKELSSLDELDRVSVELHRIFKARADEIRKKNLLSDCDVFEINKLLANYKEANSAFKKYILCLQEINSGSKTQTKLHNYYQSRLNKELLNVPKDIYKLINKRLDAIESTFRPIIESEKYIDYKQYDKDLVTQIPFILTYKTTINLGVPLKVENEGETNNQVLFQNVASSLFIKPSRVTYFYNYNPEDNDKIISALQYVINCMDSHNIRAAINLCVLSDRAVKEDFIEKIGNLSNRVNHIDCVIYSDEDDLEDKLFDYIKSKRFTALEKNNSLTSNLLYGMRCYRNNSYFEYNNLSNTLSCSNGCEFLKYICFNPHLKVSDLFEFKNSADTTDLPDLQHDYMYFWKLYKKRTNKSEAIWKAMCNALSENNEKENVIRIHLSKSDSVINEQSYYVENSYITAFKKLMNELNQIDSQIISVTEVYSNNVCKINVIAPNCIHEKIKELLSKPYLFANPIDISVAKDKQFIIIKTNNLSVSKLELDTIRNEATKINVSYEEIIDLLKEICNSNFILNLKNTQDNDSLSFTYSSHQIKSLMTTTGRILELYVYYKAIENGGFDDVANSVEVVWNNDNVGNEFDIILTKGFRSLIVECKAQTQLKQEVYYKLDSLNRRFGINSIPIIVADTIENPYFNNSANDIQRSRGNEIGIKTIYENKDISNIGKTLKSLLNNN